jgi:hypothetical protein
MPCCFMQSKMGSYTEINDLYNIIAILYSIIKKKHPAVSILEKTYYLCIKNNKTQ